MNPTTQHTNNVPSSVGTSTSSGNVAANAPTTMTQHNSYTNVNNIKNLQNSANTTTTPTTNAPGKLLIRKITPIDPKKLQQSGLDRKIAEALSKQKLQTGVPKSTHTPVSTPKTFTSSTPTSVIKSAQTTARPCCSSSAVIKSTPTLQPPTPTVVTAIKRFPTKIIPPKITITGPEAPTELDKKHLVGLSPEQRLKHVKHLLNKKLLLKKSLSTNDIAYNDPEILVHLKPPSPQKFTTIPSAGLVHLKGSVDTTFTDEPVVKTPSYQKLEIFTEKPTSTSTAFVQLKEPVQTTFTNKPVVNTSYQKLQTIYDKPPPPPPPTPTGFVHLKGSEQSISIMKPVVNSSSGKFKAIDDKPPPTSLQTTPSNKTVIKIPQKSPQDIARKLDFETQDEVPKILQFVRKNPTKFLYKDEKHSPKLSEMKNDIPKASIKPAANPTLITIKQLMKDSQNNDFPEVSPLKIPFPTVNVPQETPLPTIDTFKKPYPMPPSNYYLIQTEAQVNNAAPMEYMTANYETVPTEPPTQQPTNANDLNEASSSYVSTTPNSNSLIVLENKVLSQDEMIDLTALRLSSSNVGAPQRFARPHKPIPEVVIKQEKPDDFPTTIAPECNKSLNTAHDQRQSKTSVNTISVQKDPVMDEEDLSTEAILLPAKQNKKIIINAQKLKLPPGKIAELAKKIAQTTGSQMPSNKTNMVKTQTQVKPELNLETRVLNTKAAYKRNSLPNAKKYVKEISYAANTESKQLAANQISESHLTGRIIVQTKTNNDQLQAAEVEKLDQAKIYNNASHRTAPTSEVKQSVNEIHSQSQTPTTEVKQLEQQKIFKPTDQLNYLPQTSTSTVFMQSFNDHSFKPNNTNSLIVKTPTNNDQIEREEQANLTNFQIQDNSLNNCNIAKTSTTSNKIESKQTANSSLINSEICKAQFVKKYKKDQEKISVIVKEEPEPPNFDSPPKESPKNLCENLLRSPVIKPLPPHGLKNPTIKAEDRINYQSTTIQNETFPSYSNTSFIGNRKSAVEIIDDPPEMEDSFSAVDFLAAFADTNPITEETTLELSPEELNLNASCAMNLSPIRIPSYSQRKRHLSSSQKQVTKPETSFLPSSSLLFQPNDMSVEIGNIVNMQDGGVMVDIDPQNVNFTMDNFQSMNTIVIQSSNGPETIVTKTLENKCPILTIPGNKLKPVKIVNVLDSNKMGLPKIKDMEHTIKTTHAHFMDSKISAPLNTKRSTDFEVSYKDFLNKSNKYNSSVGESAAKSKKLTKSQINSSKKLTQKTTEKTVTIPVRTTEISSKSSIQTTEKSVNSPVNTTEKSVTSLVKTTKKSILSLVKTPIKSTLKQNSQEDIEKLNNTETLKEKRLQPTESQKFKTIVKTTEKAVKLPANATEISVEPLKKTTAKAVKSPVKTLTKSMLKQNSQEGIGIFSSTETTEKLPKPTESQKFKSTVQPIVKSANLPFKETEISIESSVKASENAVISQVKTPIKSILKQNSQENVEKLICTKTTEKRPKPTESQEFNTTEKSVKSPLKATEISVKSLVKTTEKSVKSPVKTSIKSILKQKSQEGYEKLINTETTEKLPEPTKSQEFKSTTADCIQNSLPAKTQVISQIYQDKPTESFEEMGQMNLCKEKSPVKINEKALDFSKSTELQTTQSNESKSAKKHIQKKSPAKPLVKLPESSVNLKSSDRQQKSQIESSAVLPTTSEDSVEFTLKDLITAEDSSLTKSEEPKSFQDSEQSKSNESNCPNTNVPSKRISRFKKGKINLVQRNKKSVSTEKYPTAAEEKSFKEEKSKTESSSGETIIDNTNNTTVITAASEDMTVSEESGSAPHNENKIISTLNDNISQNQVIKDVIVISEKQVTDKTPQQDISKDLKTREYKNSTKIPTEISNTKTTNSNTIGCNDSLYTPIFPSNTEIATSSSQCLNTTEDGNKQSDNENTTYSSQYLDATEDAINERNVEIQETTIGNSNLHSDLNKTDSIICNNQDNDNSIKDLRTQETTTPNSNLHSNSNKTESITCNNQDNDKGIKDLTTSLGPGVENDVLRTEEESSEMMKSSSKNISQLLKPPKIPKRKYETKKAEELSQDSKRILEELRRAKVSLVDIVKHSPTEISQNPPQIPFKRKCTDILKKPEEPEGIKTLLKLKKSIEKEYNEEDNYKKVQNINTITNTIVNNQIQENHLESEISSEEVTTTCGKAAKSKRGRPSLKKLEKSTLETKEDSKTYEENTLNFHNSKESTSLSTTKIQHKISENLFESEISSEEPANSEKETKRKRGRPSSKIIDKSILEEIEENKKDDEKCSKSHSNIKTKFNDLFGSEKSSEEPSTSETEAKRKRGRPSLKKIDKSTVETRKDEKTFENKEHLSESETLILSTKLINKRIRHSSRHQISDDDLEFLPISSEIKELKPPNNENKIKEKDGGSSSAKSTKRTHLSSELIETEAKRTELISKTMESVDASPEIPLTKRTRVSSQPLEMVDNNQDDTLAKKSIEQEVSNLDQPQYSKLPSTAVKKRTRFSPQTSETDDKNCTRFSSKPKGPEDSCQDSSYEVNLSSIKQRKKLRKTLEDIKKSSQRPHLDTDTDSDEDDRDFNSINAFDEANEFLGFEENSEGSSKPSKHQDATEDGNNSKIISTTSATKGGTLKNWLTTGKAISPTINKDPKEQRIRHGIKLSRGVPLKKRWDFSKNHHDETDITDDTSPADDEDESETGFARKRGLKNVININKDMLDSKKIKLDETKSIQHKFREPRPVDKVTKTHVTDSDFQEVSSKKSKELTSEETEENKEIVGENAKMSDISALENPDKSVDIFDSIKEAENSRRIENQKTEIPYTKISDSCSRKLENFDVPDKSLEEEKEIAKELPNSKAMLMKDNTAVSLEDTQVVKAQSNIIADKEDKLYSKEISLKTNMKHLDDSSRISEFTEVIVQSVESVKSSLKHKKSKVSKEDKKESILTQEGTISSKSNNVSKEYKGVKDDNTKNLQKTLDSSKKHKIPKVLKEKKKLLEIPAAAEASNVDHKKELIQSPTAKLVSESIENKDEATSSLSTPKSKFLTKTTLKTENATAECSPSTPKKRGRKPKPKTKDSSEDDSAPCIPKKRARKRKYKISYSSDENTPLSETNKNVGIPDNLQPIATPHLAILKNDGDSNELSKPPGFGRRRAADTAENNFNPRLLLITKREQLDNNEVLTEPNQGTGDIQCGLCLRRTTAKKWTLHLADHYGIGWQVGGVKLNIENRSVVLSSIINYYKSTDIKGLNCRMCKKLYRSALGVLQHIEACGAEIVRVMCEYCNKDLAKMSLPSHLRTCPERVRLQNSFDENVNDALEQPQQDVFSNTGRLKRHSTIKAENKLKAIGAELENNRLEPREFNPHDLLHCEPPLNSDEVNKKWLEDIKQLGKGFCPKPICKFNSPIIEELENHIKECREINTGYFCIPCKRRHFDTEKQALQHINSYHKPRKLKKKIDSDSDCDLKTDDEQSSEDENYLSDGVNEDEIDESEVEEDDDDIVTSDREYTYSQGHSTKRNFKGYGKNRCNHLPIQRQRVYGARANDLSKEVYNKWKKFLSLNYSSESIFPDFTSQYTTINNQDFAKYLPPQVSSMKLNVNIGTKLNKEIGLPEFNVEWMELKRFESIESKKTETFFFLGAPIKFVCWVPLPANVDEQYLLVGYRKDMFKFVKHTQPKQHNTILMIFKVTLLNKLPKIEIHYGFTIKDGPVHCVAFLPSGGYNTATNRLGLVAVGTINATTKVYSLPINIEIEECDKIENVAIIDIKPSFQLNLDVIDQGQTEHIVMKPQCISIQWSETSGHNLIFAGFSNGFIGIWDVTDDYQENLNRFVVENIVNFAAVNYFYIGEKGVNYFAIQYDTEGPRWLAISAKYRKFIIYDIKNLMMPMVIKDEWNRNILQCMDWCPVWSSLLTGYSDAIPNNGRCVMAINPINVIYTQQRVDYMCSGVTQIHYTPVINMGVFAVDNGDIVFVDPREFHYEQPLGRKYDPSRRIVASMDIKQLDGKPIFKPPTKQQQAKAPNECKLPSTWTMPEQDYKNKYGLVFNSFIKIKEANKSAYKSEKRRPPINITPLMRINSLRCNLNLNAKRLVAAGYENGILRIIYFNKEYQLGKS